jgi:uncharacterized protein YeaO (DUF488 family)
MKVWTAQYNYKGRDRLDITVKGNDPLGKYFAPTWEMVWGYKLGKITEEEYTKKYKTLMFLSYKEHKDKWEELLSKEEVTLVCFCAPGKFCHRTVLAEALSAFNVEYIGERKYG